MCIMKIQQNYSRNINLGNYQTARIGITLEKEVENPNEAKIKKISNKLLELCKKLVNEELADLKEEEQIK